MSHESKRLITDITLAPIKRVHIYVYTLHATCDVMAIPCWVWSKNLAEQPFTPWVLCGITSKSTLTVSRI